MFSASLVAGRLEIDLQLMRRKEWFKDGSEDEVPGLCVDCRACSFWGSTEIADEIRAGIHS